MTAKQFSLLKIKTAWPPHNTVTPPQHIADKTKAVPLEPGMGILFAHSVQDVVSRSRVEILSKPSIGGHNGRGRGIVRSIGLKQPDTIG